MKPREKEMQTSKSTPISPSFSQQPWLLQLRGTKERTVRFINPLTRSVEEQSVPEMQGKVCLGCFGDWLLLLQRKNKGMSLLNLASLDEIVLPAIPEPLESLGCFALSSSPSSPSSSNKCVIVTVSTEHNFILCCTLKDRNWTKIHHISRLLYSREIAICWGRIYAQLKSQAIAVIDLESLPTGAICGEIVSLPESFRFQNTTHLVASSETIFSVSVTISAGLVTDVHIYKLDTGQLASRKFKHLNAAASRCSNSLRSSFSFSSIPTNSDCIVLAVVSTEYQCVLNIGHRGRSSWKEEIISLADNPFSHVPVSPVFFRDEFYILGTKGDLLVFNPTTKKRRFLDTLAPVNSAGVLDAEKEECYLLELDGNLIYVFKRNNIETFSVVSVLCQGHLGTDCTPTGCFSRGFTGRPTRSRSSTQCKTMLLRKTWKAPRTS